jgi:hypothetical protein
MPILCTKGLHFSLSEFAPFGGQYNVVDKSFQVNRRSGVQQWLYPCQIPYTLPYQTWLSSFHFHETHPYLESGLINEVELG